MGHEEIALFLLCLPGQEKYDINVGGADNVTMLHAAASGGLTSVVMALVLTRNANINLEDAGGHKPICAAIVLSKSTGEELERTHGEVIRFLLEQHCLQDGRSRQDVLENICCTRDPLLFHVLCRDRGDIEGNKARFAMAAFLMNELAADPYCTAERCLDGHPPLRMNLLQAAASFHGDISVVRWLLTDRNFPVDLQTLPPFRGTALHLTVTAEQESEAAQLEIVKLLVEVGGANVLLKRGFGETALELCQERPLPCQCLLGETRAQI
jgi:ankyrin repeat protein